MCDHICLVRIPNCEGKPKFKVDCRYIPLARDWFVCSSYHVVRVVTTTTCCCCSRKTRRTNMHNTTHTHKIMSERKRETSKRRRQVWRGYRTHWSDSRTRSFDPAGSCWSSFVRSSVYFSPFLFTHTLTWIHSLLIIYALQNPLTHLIIICVCCWWWRCWWSFDTSSSSSPHVHLHHSSFGTKSEPASTANENPWV